MGHLVFLIGNLYVLVFHRARPLSGDTSIYHRSYRSGALARLTCSCLPLSTIYVSLALAIYIVVRGDTAQIAIMLPYLAGVLQILVRRAP